MPVRVAEHAVCCEQASSALPNLAHRDLHRLSFTSLRRTCGGVSYRRLVAPVPLLIGPLCHQNRGSRGGNGRRGRSPSSPPACWAEAATGALPSPDGLRSLAPQVDEALQAAEQIANEA